MGTRSLIGYLQEGKVRFTYPCHYDGYVEWTGKLLHEWFADHTLAISLIKGEGSIISINPRVHGNGCKVERFPPDPDDIGPAECDAGEFTPKEIGGMGWFEIEYFYLWDGEMWWVRSSHLPVMMMTVKDALTVSTKESSQ
jgi:hypothetical protein